MIKDSRVDMSGNSKGEVIDKFWKRKDEINDLIKF